MQRSVHLFSRWERSQSRRSGTESALGAKGACLGERDVSMAERGGGDRCLGGRVCILVAKEKGEVVFTDGLLLGSVGLGFQDCHGDWVDALVLEGADGLPPDASVDSI